MSSTNKRKSYRDIERQASRITKELEQRATGDYMSRIDRVAEIRQRYRDNISRATGGSDLSPSASDPSDITAANRKVARTVYMGLSST